MRALHRLVRWLEISEADMEKGQLRCDANVSVRMRGEDRLGTRTELKNINSFRYVQHAVEHEILRQIRLVDSGGRVVRETRLWDADRGQSAPMRTKEEADDYRYFPDPDLPPLVVDGPTMAGILRAMPELPAVRFGRYRSEHGISADDARTLVSTARCRTTSRPCSRRPARAARSWPPRWVLTELLGKLNADGKDIADAPMPPVLLAALIGLIEDGTISGKIGKEVFEECYRTGESPLAIVDRRGVRQISDAQALGEVIDRVVAANPKQVESYLGGKDTVFGFFVGQVMKETQARANPVLTTELLRETPGALGAETAPRCCPDLSVIARLLGGWTAPGRTRGLTRGQRSVKSAIPKAFSLEQVTCTP